MLIVTRVLFGTLRQNVCGSRLAGTRAAVTSLRRARYSRSVPTQLTGTAQAASPAIPRAGTASISGVPELAGSQSVSTPVPAAAPGDWTLSSQAAGGPPM
jgi:hypothetical protein